MDIEPGGLEWEPADRRMTLGVEPETGAVRWRCATGAAPLDRSANASPGSFPARWAPARGRRTRRTGRSSARHPGGGWREPAPTGGAVAAGPRPSRRRARVRGAVSRAGPRRRPGPAPVETTLARLGLALAALSAIIWGTAAVAGRRLCLHALSPVSRMARAATAMTAADLGHRLPAPGTRDELDELGTPSTTCSTGCTRRSSGCTSPSTGSNGSPGTPRTSSARRWRPCSARSRSRSAATAHRRNTGEFLERVQAEGVRLRQIVESLLLLAQFEGERPESDEIDLGAWVIDHLRRWSNHPRAADLAANVDDSGPTVVQVHPPLLAQLVDNLLENACKYSEPGTPVVVRSWQEGGSVSLSVEDRGRGLAADELANVFEPFFRGGRHGEGHTGVGLGLAVARRIAATFGGRSTSGASPESGASSSCDCPRRPVPGHERRRSARGSGRCSAAPRRPGVREGLESIQNSRLKIQ